MLLQGVKKLTTACKSVWRRKKEREGGKKGEKERGGGERERQRERERERERDREGERDVTVLNSRSMCSP